MIDDRMRPGRGTSRERGYTRKWERERKVYLTHNPLCVMCKTSGVHRIADVVDHIIPHRGNQKLFWDRGNWQSLCYTHHNRDKQRIENGKRPIIGVDKNGWPLS